MNIMQALSDIRINCFGAQLLAESFLKSPIVVDGKPLRFSMPIQRSDCAGYAGVRITLEPIKAGENTPADDLRTQVRTAWLTSTPDFRRHYDEALFKLLGITSFQDLQEPPITPR